MNSLPSRGSTTEPDTPSPGPQAPPQADTSVVGDDFAYLIPTTASARKAIQDARRNGDEYHQSFIRETDFNGQTTLCFVLRLGSLPVDAQKGWRIGKGRQYAQSRNANLTPYQEHRGVDFLIDTTGIDQNHGLAGMHACLGWAKGAAGFFLVASGNTCILSGIPFSDDRRTIPFANTIQLGDFVFTLKYVGRSPAEEELFQVELERFMRLVLNDQTPIILPTPNQTNPRLGEWTVHHAMARGGFGTVYMVTDGSGQVAAAKQLLKTKHKAEAVDAEIKMIKRIQTFNYKRLLTPFDIRHVKCTSDIEIKRIRALLDNNWDPETFGNITDEYTIFMPYHNATLRALITSDVTQRQREVFFAKVVEGIAFLHSQRLAHRDIKPENILIRAYDPPEPVITDFGCMSDRAINRYDGLGTLHYLAPEQKEGKMHGIAVDCWACGIIGWELICCTALGHRLHPGKYLKAVQEHLDRKFTTTGSAVALCSRSMLEADPDKRLKAANACQIVKEAGILGVKDEGDENSSPKRTKKIKAVV